MSSQLDDMVDADSRLHQVLADYLEAVEEGRPTNRQRLLAEHPELADELRAFFDDRDFMKRCAGRMQFVVPTFIGKYQVLEEIGSGTFGVVVKARHPELPLLRAIKLFRGKQGSACAEARKAALLKHPNIVQVHEVGEHEGRAYYMMDFIDGEDLAQRLKIAGVLEPSKTAHTWLVRIGRWLAGRPTDEECRQRSAAELVAKVARAVHHAHQRGVIHRDLKPGNILLDDDNEPHITDFDLAKLVEEDRWHFELGPIEEATGLFGSMVLEDGLVPDTVVTDKRVIIGTAAYMSPEAAAGGELTTASDIYSLGVVLYEMLTGQVPIRGNTPTETLQLKQKETPRPPMSFNHRIDRRLDRLCMKCLQRKPQDRYGSAQSLATDLDRWRKDEPLIGVRDSLSERCRLWSRRYPALAGWLVTAALLLVLVLVTAVSVARARAARLEDEVLKSNAFAAQGVASTVLWQLERWSQPVVEMANDPKLRELILRQEIQAIRKEQPLEVRKQRLKEHGHGLQAYFKRAIARYSDPATGFVGPEEAFPFETIHLLNSDGISLENRRHNGSGGDVTGMDAHGRAYFIGAMGKAGLRGRDAVHISRVYESHIDSLNKFSISVPVTGPDGLPIGVVSATITTDSTLGLIRLHDERRTGVLVDRWDPNPSAGPVLVNPPVKYVLMVHPAYHRGDKPFDVASEQLHAVHQSLSNVELHLRFAGRDFDPGQTVESDYRDPVSTQNSEYAGRWLAGFAPVGNTEMAVIVQQRYDDAIPPDHGVLWVAIAVLLGFLLIVPLSRLGFPPLTPWKRSDRAAGSPKPPVRE